MNELIGRRLRFPLLGMVALFCAAGIALLVYLFRTSAVEQDIAMLEKVSGETVGVDEVKSREPLAAVQEFGQNDVGATRAAGSQYSQEVGSEPQVGVVPLKLQVLDDAYTQFAAAEKMPQVLGTAWNLATLSIRVHLDAQGRAIPTNGERVNLNGERDGEVKFISGGYLYVYDIDEFPEMRAFQAALDRHQESPAVKRELDPELRMKIEQRYAEARRILAVR